MVTFSVLFIFKRRSNNGFSEPCELDVTETKPILPLKVFFLEIVHPDLQSRSQML